jgi:sporulation protein YlmC with PRC-barrel domain
VTATLQLLGESRFAFANPYQDVRGWQVRDVDGQELGRLDDVLIDEAAQKVRFLKVAHGGILGLGTTHSFIPIEAVVAVANGVVTVETRAARVAEAPRFDPGLINESNHVDDLYSHYGYQPPWAPMPAFRLEGEDRTSGGAR